MERSNLIDYTSDGIIAERRKALRADGYVLKEKYDLNKAQGAYNDRVAQLNLEGSSYKTLIVGGTTVELYLRAANKKIGFCDSDIDWDAPFEDVRGRVWNVLK